MSRYTQEQFEEHYKKLPPALRRALHSPDNATTMIEIGKKHGLTIEEIGYAAEEIGFVIMGLTPARLFVKALKERLNKSEDAIKDLAADINHQVFYSLREELKKAHDFDLTAEAIQEGAAAAIPQKPTFPPRGETSVRKPELKQEVPQPIPHTGIRPIDLRKSMVAESQSAQAGPKQESGPERETPMPASRFSGPTPQFRASIPQPPPQKPPAPPSPKPQPFSAARPAPLQTLQTSQKSIPPAEKLPMTYRSQTSERAPIAPREPAKPAQPQFIKPAQPFAPAAPRETPKQIPSVARPKSPSILPYLEPISEKVPPIDLRKINEKLRQAGAGQEPAKFPQTKRAPELPQKKDAREAQTEGTLPASPDNLLAEEIPHPQKKPDVPQKQTAGTAQSSPSRPQSYEKELDPYREPFE